MIVKFEEMAVKEQAWLEERERDRIQRKKEEALEQERRRIENEKQDRVNILLKEADDWHRAVRVRIFVQEALKSELRSKEWADWAYSIADEIDPLI